MYVKIMINKFLQASSLTVLGGSLIRYNVPALQTRPGVSGLHVFPGNKIALRCAQCGRSFQSSSGLELHENLHKGLYRPVCGRGFAIYVVTWCSMPASRSSDVASAPHETIPPRQWHAERVTANVFLHKQTASKNVYARRIVITLSSWQDI